MQMGGLVGSTIGNHRGGTRSFPGGARGIRLVENHLMGDTGDPSLFIL